MTFRVNGSLVELLHHYIKYTDGEGNENTVFVRDQQEVELMKRQLEIFEEATDFVVGNIDTSSYDWLEGLDVGTQDNAMQKAIEIYNMGEQAYLDSINAPSKMESLEKENRQLKARVSAQEENSKFLEDCLIEMASVVYS